MIENFEIIKDFEEGIKKKEFKVYLQPKFNSRTREFVGAEALIRRVTSQKIIYPDSFIPVYEEIGLITRLDFYVLEEVCSLMQKWQSSCHFISIAVNQSAKHLSNKNYDEELMSLLNKYNISSSNIELEVTESAVINDMVVAKEAQKKLHELGFITSMDDFGVGYSSFKMLKNIPIDVLKIDKSFLENIFENVRCQIILEGIVHIAHKLKVITVMEGVETEQEANYLKTIGIDILQGYYFDKPLTIANFEKKYLT